MSRLRERGFTMVEGVVIVIVVLVLASVSYMAYKRMKQQDSTKKDTTSEQSSSADTPSAPTVNNTSDLDEATAALDKTNLDASATDSADLDKELNNF